MNIFHICDSPMAYYYQRLSNSINQYTEHSSRYYSNTSSWSSDYIVSDYIDLTQNDCIDELQTVVHGSDVIIFHATRNYNKPLVCSDGLFDIKKSMSGKKKNVLIHGQPETFPENIQKTIDFITNHKENVKFLVATPNQLSIFPYVELFPIVGQFSANCNNYQRSVRGSESNGVTIVRRNEWKAKLFMHELLNIVKDNTTCGRIHSFLLNSIMLYKKLDRFTIIDQILLIKKLILNDPIISMKIYHKDIGDLSIIFDNKCFWQPHEVIINDLSRSDILLENDVTDYPGGGTSHTIGHEAMCMGVAVINAMTVNNSRIFANWLGTDELPPFPNWLNENDFYDNYKDYLRKLIFDCDFLEEKKEKSREYFIKYMDINNTLPRLIKILKS